MEKKINKKSNSINALETAYENIKSRILTMEIKPGEIVSENSFSRELGISRTPVREALKKLEQDGLIITSNRRKRVFILTIHEITEIFDLKISIEGSIARWAAERGEKNDFNKLQKIVDEMGRFSNIQNETTTEIHEWINEWLVIDNQFHDCLFKMAGNKRAEQIIRNLNYQWHRLRLGILAMEGRIQKSVKEHKNIAQAIISEDSKGAEMIMRDHLENLKRMIVNIMSAFHFPT